MISRLATDQQAVIGTLASAFAADGQALYLVGGVVRDILLERDTPTDLDLATSARPEQVKAIASRLDHQGLYDVGERFGTIGIVFAGERGPLPVEITTFRSEQYEPGNRHPEVAYGDAIGDDLARRDVTINAIAVDVANGAIVDPFYGQADLAMGLLRAVGDPDERFREDPLRLLRVARFVSQLGFAVETETRAAMRRQAETIETVSAERILAEVTRLLCGEYADHGLETLLETGLLCRAMPELIPLEDSVYDYAGIHREKDLWDHTKRVVVQSPPRSAVRWAALLHDAAKPLTRTVDAQGEVHFFGHERVGAELARRLLDRLKADKATRIAVARLVDMHLRCASYDAATWTDSAVRRLALEADGILPDLLDLAAADVTSARAHKQRAAASRVQGLRDHLARLEAEMALDRLQSPLDGNDLMRMFDRRPGKWIAEVKDHLRELVIDGELAPGDRDTASRIARDLVAAMDAG
ncbi:MAG: CCA tRNA nucleotidyltransferase [Chloroflexota bacterium]|nr:CCA tRNA nucleotidyltransferase [Chloroflexota bacterium]